MFKKFSFLIPLLILPFVLVGCFNLQTLDEMVVKQNEELAQSARDNFEDDLDVAKAELKQKAKDKAYEVAEKAFHFVAESLTNEAKDRIDDWLASHNFNEYGDPEDTMYAGGSPLFDEGTGEQKDKYEYILEQHPELVDELGL